ncbi:D-alanine--D-alanine ligase family protein [Glutamicibacter sp. 287]|uniref:D-alanine--D-alanine ligase family protein n=1 Tax=unclassified Glutamicibacter TaxID=2627139 RepID=UPI000BB86DE8|nr:D-alanine--D-alanine ligase family protein [Glutamicibacter sp. BW80]PCC28159.1 D-alanine--D-alanine ligase A [Glutamicibacter sp. BW80]
MSQRKPRVLLLFGGRSSEHSVSCVTAAGVMQEIDKDRFDVIPVGITRDGAWTLVDEDSSGWTLSSGKLPEIAVADKPVHLSNDSERTTLLHYSDSQIMDLGQIDVVFPLLHGPFGEDGSIQGMLEMSGVAYVGSGIAASAMGMDKHFMKVVFENAGFNVGPYEVITNKQWLRDSEAALARCEKLQYPLFVKPARAGSSVGITKVDEPSDLRAAIDAARLEDPKVIVEQGISGREIECGVLEGRHSEPARASMPGEIAVAENGHTFYDFEAKYVDGTAAKLSCPAVLSDEATASIRELAVNAFDAIDAEGLSRVDFFYTPDGQWIINEINTMPGFTPSSMYPQMWDKTGIGYSALIDELIALACERKIGLR